MIQGAKAGSGHEPALRGAGALSSRAAAIAAAGGSRLRLGPVATLRAKRGSLSTAREYAKVAASGAALDNAEVFGKPCVGEHESGVAAHQLQLPVRERVPVIQSKEVRHAGAGAVVHSSLPIILASVFHARNFPQPVGGAVEPRAAQHLEQLRVVHVDFPALHQSLVQKAYAQEVSEASVRGGLQVGADAGVRHLRRELTA